MISKADLIQSKLPSNDTGASPLEFCLVVIVIGLIIAVFYNYFIRIEKSSYRTVVAYQSGIFSKAVNNLAASAKNSTKPYYELAGVKIYLNEYGWPANTSEEFHPGSSNQTPEECQQLWYALLVDPPLSSIYPKQAPPETNYYIYSINASICRFLYAKNLASPLFFDYSLITGQVTYSWNNQE